jgi:hypothetical protein
VARRHRRQRKWAQPFDTSPRASGIALGAIAANAFYERAISQHLRIGIETLRILRREGPQLHSRKLRSFDEPPFR